ncbi:CBS domain-containing protein [Polyangium sp. 6x1]|uniref:CBS domain-containing protein n=1 Tax=Polyangium sp. 6x1 TaxID=3042689 RepID=UPI0024827A02|nr:CBS domain-containing protein [Polyangium sp. 6x1]MDI1446144.1 CBS domain-containing protein [Polyangium sp. 6x1]
MKGHARHIMTHHAEAVSLGTPLEEIARLLVDARVGGVPVVDEHERVVGFVSETDLMATLLQGQTPGAAARDVMSHPPIVVDEFATTDEVMTILRTGQIHHLPVVRSGRLVGIITPLDVLRYFVEKVMPPEPEVG